MTDLRHDQYSATAFQNAKGWWAEIYRYGQFVAVTKGLRPKMQDAIEEADKCIRRLRNGEMPAQLAK